MPTPTSTSTLVVSALLLVGIGQVLLLQEPLVVGLASPFTRVTVALASMALVVEALVELVEVEIWLRAKPARKAEPL